MYEEHSLLQPFIEFFLKVEKKCVDDDYDGKSGSTKKKEVQVVNIHAHQQPNIKVPFFSF